MTDGLSLTFTPMLPWALLVALAVVAVVIAAIGLLSRLRGALVRTLAMALFLIALLGPSVSVEDRDLLPNVVAVVVDRSASQDLGDRKRETSEVRDRIVDAVKGLRKTELRVIETNGSSSDTDGTALFGALSNSLGDVPPDRIGGAIFITDGIVHDIPAKASALGFNAPVHVLVTGRNNERDRRLSLVEAPRFGIVGRTQIVRFRVNDQGPDMPPSAEVTVRRDGEEIARQTVMAGQLASVEVEITHGGANIVELSAAAVPGEISDINNKAVLTVEGIRDKLRVLLVSGEPNAGERTWRNLLKADANVDLVHFTILRPPQKLDATPIQELSLIAFPTRTLFAEKISDFDLIIFDRYAQEGILPPIYFDNIADYVRNGGAILLASGADYASQASLWNTSLADILPAEPTGEVIQEPFRPKVTDTGRRHPVTRDLPGGTSDPPAWGQWFTTIATTPHSGTTVMSGAKGQSLLMLARQDKGRVALLLSDHAWLWARGYQGGGPHVDLLRRLSHWLMKEPDLEEEALRAHADGRDLVVERQTMADTIGAVTVTGPTGQSAVVPMTQTRPGLWTGTYATPAAGLWRASDGTLTTLANVGPANPREFQDLVSTTERLRPLTAETAGSVRRLAAKDGALVVPQVVSVGSGSYSGSDWIGVRQASVAIVRGISSLPLFTGMLGLALLIGLLAGMWAREGRRG